MAVEIVGRACRLPGAADVESFWRLLLEQKCSVTQIPQDRFAQGWYRNPRRGERGKAYTFAAGVIDDIWGFDPEVFGITPREARQMDPQQRLVLQLAWEALEDAGVVPGKLSGRAIGVYMGASSMDNSHRQYFDPAGTDSYLMTGNTLSLIANRVSYVLDLKGPSLTFDTACSSSLVALDYAVQDLRAGRVEAAIVGGVNALLSPFNFIGFCAASMLSPDGLCRPFDHRANGYVRAEGGVVIVLQRSDLALADRVYARIAASGMNSDGRTPGVALPSALQQAALLRALYEESGINANALAFVEAHGTGTYVGDPAEATALGEVLGARRSKPLPIGSAKSNVGHLEPASGLVGLLKAQLALERGVLPATLHVERLNPNIAFDTLNLAVATEPVRLKPNLNLAGINNFGFGGTNVHVVLEGAQNRRQRIAVGRHKLNGAGAGQGQLNGHAPGGDPLNPAVPPLLISADSPSALAELAGAYQKLLSAETEQPDQRAVARAAVHRRSWMRHRALVLAESREEMISGLASIASGQPAANVVLGHAVGDRMRTAFVFSGNGSQWAGMGREAFERSDAFRAFFKEVDRQYAEHAGDSLEEWLFDDELADRLASTEVAQPLLFAIQAAIARSLLAAGLRPDCVLGHSVGEVAAAHISGALDLAQAVGVIHARSTHQERVRGCGRMAAVNMSAQLADELIAELGLSLSVAAVNSPRSVTVAGDTQDVQRFLDASRQRQFAGRMLDIDYPFHSRFLDGTHEPLLAALEALQPGGLTYPFVSTVTGKTCDGPGLDAEYWWKNIRQPVRFQQGLDAAAERGCRVYIEIGPRPVLRTYISDTLDARDTDYRYVQTLEHGNGSSGDPIVETVARAIVAGAPVEETVLFGPPPGEHVQLPHYPWQNTQYRLSASTEALTAIAGARQHHPLLGLQLRDQDMLWESHLDTEAVPLLADHRIAGRAVMPGAAYVEMCLSAAAGTLKSEWLELRDVDFVQAMELAEGQCREVRTRTEPESGTVVIASRPRLSGEDRQTHARARYAKTPNDERSEREPAPELTISDGAPPLDAIYRLGRAFSLDYGPAFQRVTACREVGTDIIEIELRLVDQAGDVYLLHPSDLDGCFHGLNVVYERLQFGEHKLAYVPVRIGRLRLCAPRRRVRSCRIRLLSYNTRAITADLVLYAEDGEVVATLEEVRFRASALVHRARLENISYHVGYAVEAAPVCVSHAPEQGIGLQDAAECIEVRLDGDAASKVGENILLLELAARRVAFDALNLYAGTHAAAQPSEDGSGIGSDSAEGMPVLLRRLVNAVADPDLAALDADGLHLNASSEMPEARDVLESVLALDPSWSAECTLLIKAAADLQSILADGQEVAPFTPEALEHYKGASPRARLETDLVLRSVSEALDKWPEGRPVRILQLGAFGSALSRDLMRFLDRVGVTLVLADTDEGRVNRIAGLWRRTPGFSTAVVRHPDDLAALGQFDVVVSVNAAHQFMDPEVLLHGLRMSEGGLLYILEREPSSFEEVVFAVHANRQEDGQSVARRTAASWQAVLASAGYESSAPLPDAALAGTALFIGKRAHDADRSAGQPLPDGVTVIAPAPTSRAEKNPLFEALVQSGMTSAANDDAPFALATTDTSDVAELIYIAERGALPPAEALQLAVMDLATLFRRLEDTRVRLWIIAEGGARGMTGDGPADPVMTGIWSFARTAMNEYPHFDIRLLDIASEVAEEDRATLVQAAIANPSNGKELVLTPSAVTALVIGRGSGQVHQALHNECATDGATVLGMERFGSLDDLRWVNRPRRTPGPHEVEIAVAASGLNFRDVMWAQGLLPEEALEGGFAGPTLGFEFSGTVSAVGTDVTHLAPGDSVIGMAPASFASHVTVDASAVVPLPDGVGLVDGATIPVSFLTAHYALRHLARLQPGEWVLIHGAAGGVGLAAVQIARSVGARVVATAGNPEKRALLQFLGAEHVLDTRSLEFCDRVRALTGGVDVVLNSLAGEAMERSLELLRPFGRFLELGKRDFYANTKVGLRPLRRNIAYFGIDADQLLVHQPRLASEMLRQISDAFAAGDYAPLPYRAFKASDAVEAFRLMQKSGHIGKIVIEAPDAGSGADDVVHEFRAAADGAHVIFGGTGGFGLVMAEWLADRGARHVILASRSGGGADEQLVATFADRGMRLDVARCDVTDREQVETLLQGLRAQGRLAGIAHAAMVLDDCLLRDLTVERAGRVLAPKVTGACVLDEATAGDDLDYFILFSSVAAMIGNPGQGSYVAANGYLDGMAVERRARGLKAISVAWGAITDVGVLARDAQAAASIARHTGGQSFTARGALDLLAQVLAQPEVPATVSIAAMNWSMAAKALPILATPAYAAIRSELGADEGSGETDIREAIAGLDEGEARRTIARCLAVEVAAIFRMPVEDIPLNRPLADLGMDSLMSLELYTAAERVLGIQLPMVSLSDGVTLSDMAGQVLTRINAGAADVEDADNWDIVGKHVADEVDGDMLRRVGEEVAARERTIGQVT